MKHHSPHGLLLSALLASACGGSPGNSMGADSGPRDANVLQEGGAASDAAVVEAATDAVPDATVPDARSEDGGDGAVDASLGPPSTPGECQASPPWPTFEQLEADGKIETVVPSMTLGSVRFFYHEGYVYWWERNLGVVRRPVSGGATETLFADGSGGWLRLDGGQLYWGTAIVPGGPLKSVPLAQLSVAPTVMPGTLPGYLHAVSDGVAFGHNADDDTVWRVTVATGAVQTLANANIDEQMVAGDGYLYMLIPDLDLQVQRVSSGGGELEGLFGSNSRLSGLTLEGDQLYWGAYRRIYGLDLTMPPSAQFDYVGRPAESEHVVEMTAFAVRKDRIYWADDYNRIGWTSRDLMHCGVLVDIGVAGHYAFAFSDEHVYAVTNHSSTRMWRLAL